MESVFRTSVVASHVTNLTDARYFAARGIDFLLYDVEAVGIGAISEIQDWVSGPKTLLLFSDSTVSELDEAVIKIAPYGISTKGDSKALRHLQGHVEIFDWDVDQLVLSDRTYVAVDHYIKDSDTGVLIRGGEEETVGIKSFDELDEILDGLEK